jgi:autophagy-related protein 18
LDVIISYFITCNSRSFVISQIGEVQVFDTVNLRAVTMIPAHDNKLAAIEFNSSGTRLATASEKGTVVRVFSVPEGKGNMLLFYLIKPRYRCLGDILTKILSSYKGLKLHEFRRGVKRCVSIYSLSFSSDSQYLAASSNTETVHIFRLENGRSQSQDGRRASNATQAGAEAADGGWMGYLGKEGNKFF